MEQFEFTGTPFCIGHVEDFEANKPYKIVFLNKPYVLWKNNMGKVSILNDICPHCFAPLSNGKICEKRDTILCPYHNFEFDGKGNHVYAQNQEWNEQLFARTVSNNLHRYLVILLQHTHLPYNQTVVFL